MSLREQRWAAAPRRKKTGRVCGGVVTLLSVALLPAVAAGDAEEPGSERVAEALGQVSLAWRAGEWPELTLRAREELRETVEPEVYRRISQAIAREFDMEALWIGVTTAMLEPESIASIGALGDFYASAPGAELSAVRQRAPALTDFPPFVAERLYQPERLQAPDARQRREHLLQLGRSLGLADNVLMVAGAISGALRAGSFLSRCAPPPLGRSTDPRDDVEWARPLVEGRTRLALDYLHRDHDLTELSRELHFAKSDEGQQALAAVSDALEVALEQAANRVAIVSERAGGCKR